MKCPTCGRPPSEREHYELRWGRDTIDRCPDPIHDLADRCVELEKRSDDAEGALASICDLVNTACRETGVDESPNYLEPTGGPIKRAVERVVHRLRSRGNASLLHRDRLRAERDALRAELAEADAVIKQLRDDVRDMLNELGVPTDDYPAPVANAVTLGEAALIRCPEPSPTLRPCAECEGSGELDSGGVDPAGNPISVPCPACAPTPAANTEEKSDG